jgi:hypothetical protein
MRIWEPGTYWQTHVGLWVAALPLAASLYCQGGLMIWTVTLLWFWPSKVAPESSK